MAYEVKTKAYWGLNLLIVVLAAILVAVLLIPQKIWNEEAYYRDLSRSKMTNLWKVEKTFFNLAGQYTENGKNAIKIVNLVYDSLKQGTEFNGKQTVKLPNDSVMLSVNREAITYLFDSTLADTSWSDFRGKILALYNDMANDSVHSGQFAYQILQTAYDSLIADTSWTGTKKIVHPYTYEINVPQNYVQEYDTTFVHTERIQRNIRDTSYVVVTTTINDDSTVTYDTTTTAKRQLSDMKFRYPDLKVVDSTVTIRDRWITEATKTRPDTSWLYDPLTGQPYIIQVSANGLHVKIQSPIKGEYTEKRYYVFTFSDTSHGYLEDGEPSWEGNQ